MNTVTKIFFLNILITALTACSVSHIPGINYTKHWQGSDLPGHTYASFDEFNGKQDFRLQQPATAQTFFIKYTTIVEDGKLHMTIKSNERTLISQDIASNAADSIAVNGRNNEKFKVVFDASHAKGNFDIRYGTIH